MTFERWWIVACAACAILATSSCTRSGSPAGPTRSQTLIVGIRSEPPSLDPLMLQGALASLIGSVMYSYLFTSDRNGRLVPDAATVIPTVANGGISPDGLHITYHLRSGITWQDGTPLTARDCVFSYRAIMNPRNNVASREGYDRISDVRAPNASTVVVTLRQRFSPIVDLFLSIASNYPILPAHIWADYPDLNHAPFEERSIGSGPYRFITWWHGDDMTFAANRTYFGGAPGFKHLIVRFIPSTTTMLDELRTGELDAVPSMDDPSVVSQLRALPRLRVVINPLSGVMGIALNVQSGPAADPRIRSAFAHGIDVARIAGNASDNVYSSNDALRGMFGRYYQPVAALSFDPEAARVLLDAAGWKMSDHGIRTKNGKRLAVVLAVSNTSVANSTIALEIQSELRNIGADVTIRSYAPTEFIAPAADGGPLFGGAFDLALVPIIFSPAGPEAASYFTCAQRMPIGFNFTRFCDPAFDALYNDSVRSYDETRQRRDVAAMERKLVQLVPWIPLYQLRGIAAIPANLHGYAPSFQTPYVEMQQWRIAAHP